MLTLLFFFFNDTATTEIYTLSLHDALPIFLLDALEDDDVRVGRDAQGEDRARDAREGHRDRHELDEREEVEPVDAEREDRKSTRLNSSHANISYAVFCLKKKKQNQDDVALH